MRNLFRKAWDATSRRASSPIPNPSILHGHSHSSTRTQNRGISGAFQMRHAPPFASTSDESRRGLAVGALLCIHWTCPPLRWIGKKALEPQPDDWIRGLSFLMRIRGLVFKDQELTERVVVPGVAQVFGVDSTQEDIRQPQQGIVSAATVVDAEVFGDFSLIS